MIIFLISLSERHTAFNPAVLDEVDSNGDIIRTWCSPGVKPDEAYCTMCNTIIICSQHGRSAVKRHSTFKTHLDQRSKMTRNESGKPKLQQKQLTVSSWNSVKIANRDKENVTTAETMFALMIAQKDLPYSLGDVANDIFPEMFIDSKIAKEFSCSRKKVSYMISDGIAPFLKEEMVADILKSGAFYTIQIDETPISEKRVNQLDILIRYYSEKYQKVVVDHLESFHIGHCTSENLLECINAALTELPSEKLLSFYSDGPNVMKSLKSKLKVANPQLLDIGECSLHKIHNAFSAALNLFGSDVESLIMDIYYYFKRSPAQSDDLKNLQVEMDVAIHIFTRHVSSRWLTLNQSVSRFVEQLPVLKAFFDKEIKKFNTRETERWRRLSLTLADKTIHAKALFLQNSSDLFTGFLLLLQKEEPLIHILYDELLSLVRKILGRFLNISVFQGKQASELKAIDLQKGEYWLKRPEVGSDTLKVMASWTSSEKKEFFLGARSFYIKCAENLLKSLPLENQVLRSLQCLHPLFRYEKVSSTYIRHLATTVPTVVLPCDVSSLVDEWIVYQSDAPDINANAPSTSADDEPSTSADEPSISADEEPSSDEEQPTAADDERSDKYWNRILAEKDLSGKSKYKHLPVLIKALLSLAHGNADCERGFSENKNILESRSNLCAASINGIRRIKSELKKCGSIKNFNINPKLLSSVKTSWRRYENRTKAEKNIEKKEKEKISADNNLLQLKSEEQQLKKRLESTQILLKKAELSITDGLKRKSFIDVECGQVLLKDCNKKTSEIMFLLEKNRKAQSEYSNVNPEKRKRRVD